MPDIYIPGVRQDWNGRYGWTYSGGPRKFILHSTESPPMQAGNIHALCAYLDGWANPHVVWDPWTGDMAMNCRADWAGGALVTGNKDGSVVLQVEAVGYASGVNPNNGSSGWRPFADSPMKGWDKILAWADSWGIPRTFPAGPAPESPAAYGYNNGHRPTDVWWAQSGYYCHSQVPGNDHSDPGIVDLDKIFPGSKPPASVPLKTKLLITEMVLHRANPDGVWDTDSMKRLDGIRDMINPAFHNDRKRVRYCQQVMAFNAANTDGIWGPKTEAAWKDTVIKLQTAWQVSPVDGIWGPRTEFAYQVVHNQLEK